jgi:hypothetical protein
VRQSPAGDNLSTEAEDIVGTFYQVTAEEDTADSKDLLRAVANRRMRDITIAL